MDKSPSGVFGLKLEGRYGTANVNLVCCGGRVVVVDAVVVVFRVPVLVPAEPHDARRKETRKIASLPLDRGGADFANFSNGNLNTE